MHKTRLHEIVWFPFRPEQRFIGPLLVCLLLVVGATGIVKTVDIFTSFISQNTLASDSRILVLIFALCLAVCVNAARSDYISIAAALLPCLVTTITLIAASALITAPKADLKSALVQAAVGTFVSLGLVGRFVQSGAADLGSLGAILRRSKRQIKKTLSLPPSDPSFAIIRSELVKDVQSLASALQSAAPDVVARASCTAAAKRLEEFVARSQRVEHDDLQRDLTEGPTALIETLKMINGAR